MGSKKHKRQYARQAGAGWGEAGYGQGAYGAMGGMNNGQDAGGWGQAGYGPGAYGAMGGMNNSQGAGAGFNQYAWNDMFNGTPGADRGFLNGLQGMVGSRHTEQFVLGALIGAAAVYVLGDEEMRNKLLKSAMKLYAGIAGGFEEIKEQVADIRAEVEAETRG